MVNYRTSNQAGAKLIDEACAKWTGLPSLTIARKIYEENKLVFPSLDAVRTAVRYRRGRRKFRALQTYKESIYGTFACTSPSVPNPFRLPDSDERIFEPYTVNVDRDTRCLVLPDIHIPYHNVAAITAALAVGRKADARLILLNGDQLDFHQISHFDRIPTKKRVKEEIELCKQLLDAIQESFPKARIIWKDGNHDERLDKFMLLKAPELWDLEVATLSKLLELPERGIEQIKDRRTIMLGKLPVLHGHEYRQGFAAPVNPARGLFLRTKHTAMQSHCHQSSEHNEKDVKGSLITTWSTGCLCELHPHYDPYNKWNHGCAEIDLATNGDFFVSNHRIIDGRLMN